jgi:hypothetical protein
MTIDLLYILFLVTDRELHRTSDLYPCLSYYSLFILVIYRICESLL